MLNLRLKRLRISISNISARCSYFICILFNVSAVPALALFVAKAASGEAFAVHFEALGFGALANQIFNRGASFFQ